MTLFFGALQLTFKFFLTNRVINEVYLADLYFFSFSYRKNKYRRILNRCIPYFPDRNLHIAKSFVGIEFFYGIRGSSFKIFGNNPVNNKSCFRRKVVYFTFFNTLEFKFLKAGPFGNIYFDSYCIVFYRGNVNSHIAEIIL